MAGLTLNVCVTGTAAVKLELPGWEAEMEQVPAFTSRMVLPDTVQTKGVVDVKLTGRFELAVALIAKGAVDKSHLAKLKS